MACYKISTINTPGATLNLVIPKSSITVRNGERACFCIAASIPASTSVLPVYFEINGATVPLYDLLGNTLYSDQIRRGVTIPGVWAPTPRTSSCAPVLKVRAKLLQAASPCPQPKEVLLWT